MALSPSLPYLKPRVDERHAASGTDEAELIAQSQRGDVHAFNLLVERYQRRVYAVCFRMLGDADADDATQEVFLAAFRSIRLYQGGSFIGWLLRITSNKCLDYLRARSRRPSVSLDAAVDDADGPPFQLRDPGESQDQRVLRAELAHSLMLALQELPPSQRLAVVLSDIQGYSYEDIIAATGWPAGTVKSRLSRARARLREIIRTRSLDLHG